MHEYCCLVWANILSCYLELLYKLQKRICGTVCPSLAASLKLCSSSKCSQFNFFFSCYYFGRCLSELVQLFPLPLSWGRYTCYSDTLYDFSATLPRCYKNAYVNSFFPSIGRLLNSRLIECFLLTYDLNGV